MAKASDKNSRRRLKPARAAHVRLVPKSVEPARVEDPRIERDPPVITVPATPSRNPEAAGEALHLWVPSWPAQQRTLELLERWTRYQLSWVEDCLTLTQAQSRLMSARTPAQLAAARDALVQDLDDSSRRITREWLALAAQTHGAVSELMNDTGTRLAHVVQHSSRVVRDSL